jgi:hypothetical protein
MRGDVTSTSIKYQRRPYRCGARLQLLSLLGETNSMGAPYASRRYATIVLGIATTFGPVHGINQLFRTSKPSRPVLLGLGGLLQRVGRAYRA